MTEWTGILIPCLATAREDSVLHVHVLASGVVQARWLRRVDQSMYPGESMEVQEL